MLRLCQQRAAIHPAIISNQLHIIRSIACGNVRPNQTKSNSSSLAPSASSDRTDVSTDVRPLGERIKENTKTASYLGVIAVGVVVAGGLFAAIFRELCSANSPNNVYSAALDRCVNVSV